MGISYRPYVNEKKIIAAFLFQAGTVWASWESVYDEITNDDRFDVTVIYDPGSTIEVSHNKNARQFLSEKGIPFVLKDDVDFSQYIPHIVFIQFPYDAAFHTPDMLSIQFKKRGNRVVYIPYGIEITDTDQGRRDHFESRVVENAWRIYTSCDGLKAEYDKYCRNRSAVRVTGSPKHDFKMYVDKYSLSPEYLKKADGRKIVIWKMHFPKRVKEGTGFVTITPDPEEYIKFASKLPIYDDFFFIVLPHPKMVGHMASSDISGDNDLVSLCHKLIKTIDKADNAVIDTSDDYRNSFYNGDAIIMDRSAVMIEAAMLNIPVLLMKNSSFDEPMTKPVKEVIETFVQGRTCEDIERFIEGLRNNVSFNLDDRMTALDRWFPYRDGRSGKRIVEDIADSIINEGSDDEIRVILYGTGDVASFYMANGYLRNDKIRIVGVSDSNSAKWDKDYFGHTIISPDSITSIEYDYIVIMTEPGFYDIKKSLVYEKFISDEQILHLDEFMYMLDQM